MKLEDLRKQLAERRGPNDTQTAPVAPKSTDPTIRKPEFQPWEQIGVTVLVSDDPYPEALDFARKCECGRMREARRVEGLSAHVILPCDVCSR